MATADEHAALYGELRNELLTRFFAYSRYFRANHLSLVNHLGNLFSGSTDAPGLDLDDLNVDCDNRSTRSPSKYLDAAGLLNLPPAEQQMERWRIAFHERENPLMCGSQLLIALTVEHLLGRQDALPIIRLAIQTLGSLYKFKGRHMDGYIIRWDAATSDSWATQEVDGRPKPLYSCDFMIGADGRHLYCTPFNHPAYVPYDPREFFAADPRQPNDWKLYHGNDDWPARRDNVYRYRAWEPSQDELVGLVLSYDFVYRYVEDSALREEVRQQVNNLGDYLAEHGYLLVRPDGGFSARGGSGLLPAWEYPFGRVFERITGMAYPSRSNFEQVMELAGVWRNMRIAVETSSYVGAAALGTLGVTLGTLFGAVNSASGMARAFAGALAGAATGWTIGRAAGIAMARDCFDVWDDGGRLEFAGAYLLQRLSAKQRYTLVMEFIHKASYARAFPPFLGLTALGDGDNTVRDSFFSSLDRSRKKQERGRWGNTGFATAVAVALGRTGDARLLREWLDQSFDNFQSNVRKRNIKVEDASGYVVERVREGTPNGTPESPMGALEYLACLALNWLVALRFQGQSDDPFPEGLLPTPNVGTWNKPTVPASVLSGGLVPALFDIRRDPESPLAGPRPLGLFPDHTEAPVTPDVQKPAEVPPTVPQPVTRNEYQVIVRESQSLMDIGIFIYPMDRVTIVATGTIWAGVWLTGRNGPGGWNTLAKDSKFPQPGAAPFCLLYKLVRPGSSPAVGAWTPVGPHSGDPPRSSTNFLWTGGESRLVFRTNDDNPGNGNGYFDCQVIVERPPH